MLAQQEHPRYYEDMDTETVKIPATAVRVGTVFADGATVRDIRNTVSTRGGLYIPVMVTLPGGTLMHRRLINIAGTQTARK